MNKLKLFSLLLLALVMASCSDDDDPKNLASMAVGTYDGYTDASCGYFSGMVADGQQVKLTSSAVNTVDIAYESSTWGTFTITGATLSGYEGHITIKGSGKSSMAHAGSAAKDYDCTVEGTLEGNNLTLTFTCPTVMGGLKIVFRQGQVPASIVVPGTYKGYTEAKSAYFSGMMADGQQLEVTANEDGTYKVAYISDTWGEFTIDAATATFADGKFSLKGDGTTKMGMNGNLKDYACWLEAVIDVAKENPEFTFSVPSVMGGLKIVFLTGDMPSEN